METWLPSVVEKERFDSRQVKTAFLSVRKGERSSLFVYLKRGCIVVGFEEEYFNEAYAYCRCCRTGTVP